MTRPNKDYAYDALLRFNYFPMVKNRRDDLPPVFHSEQFTPTVADDLIAAMATQNRKAGFDQVEVRTTRFDQVIRQMHIPHPLPYARLCQCLCENWQRLHHVCDNTHSQIRPERHAGRLVVMHHYDVGRLVVMDKKRFPRDFKRHLRLSFGSKIKVSADISNCFPSIYSHAISWALVGHDVAKATSGDKTQWYNKLDFHQRSLKRNETLGVPVGPATSNVISEIILAKVDQALDSRGYNFVRFIDDYQCYTNSRDDAEEFVRDLELQLDKYLLKLNAKKLQFSTLPLPEKSTWISQLQIAIGDEKTTANRMVDLLDYATDLQNRHPDASVLKYAATTLAKRLDQSNAEAYVLYLLQLAFHKPSVLPSVVETLTKFDVKCRKKWLRRLIKEHLRFRRSDAVCWAMFAAFLCGVAPGQKLRAAIVDSRDCMPMAMLIALGEDLSEVDTFLNGIDLGDEYGLDQFWLLIHERAAAESLMEKRFRKYLGESGLAFLRKKKVHFVHPVKLSDFKRKVALSPK
jgi:hypothetical protein